jgi:hypothetical protein
MGAYTWFEVARSGLPTNGTLITFSNLGVAGAALNLTNESFASTGLVVQAATLNGLATLGFKGFNALRATNYSVGVSTQEVFMILSQTNAGGASRGIFSPMVATNGYGLRFFNSTRTWQMVNGVGAGGNVAVATTNTYVLLDMLFHGSGPASTILTNGNQGLTINVPLTNMSGLLLGNNLLGDSAGSFSLAAMWTYTNPLTALLRSNNVWYGTNRFSTNGFAFNL